MGGSWRTRWGGRCKGGRGWAVSVKRELGGGKKRNLVGDEV